LSISTTTTSFGVRPLPGVTIEPQRVMVWHRALLIAGLAKLTAG